MNSSVFPITAESLRNRLPERHPDGDKKRHGTALLIAGSRGMAGAAALAARSAYRVGCGYLRLAAPAGELVPLQILVPEAVHLPMGDAATERLEASHRETLDSLMRLSSAWGIGPGLSSHLKTEQLVSALLPEWGGKGVVDADGLNAAAGRSELFRKGEHSAELVLTPHEREWERLFGTKLPKKRGDRREEVRRKAHGLKQTIVAKGGVTIVGLPDGEVWEYEGNCSGLAKAGSGDVLTGAILGLLAQGASTADAALLAVWLHGRAGVRGSALRTEYGLTAGDLPELLPDAIGELLALSVEELPLRRYH